ncbi:MAG: eukaryotic-like serine/threonine-protein kinase [Thermoanaerobaculia bacterium]|jgi:serine/threonine protein kinase|nr:eukaryotic-like serine/threonine-protein kinase [Thermoanaerobaculia bacterium]
MRHVINGYQVTTDFTTVGGGQCQWALAERDTVPLFIKRFLAPRYPVEGSPGSPATKTLKLERCRAFELHHRSLIGALQHRCAVGGNLVVARDFFRDGTSFYKVTDRVDIARLTPDHIAALPPEQQLLLLKTVTHSLSILHEARLVHCDLRPDNVLVKRTAAGIYITKLIDLDSCYFSEAPPPADQVAADPIYLSPEMSRYTAGTAVDPRLLTVKADIFSLGLLFAMFTVGSNAFSAFPSYGTQYAHEFVLAGYSVPLPWDRIPRRFAPLIRRMVSLSPEERPTAREILNALKADAPPERPSVSRLRGALVSPASAPVATRLRGTLIGSR